MKGLMHWIRIKYSAINFIDVDVVKVQTTLKLTLDCDEMTCY